MKLEVTPPTSLHGRASVSAISVRLIQASVAGVIPKASHGDSTLRLPSQPAWNDAGVGQSSPPYVIVWTRERQCNLRAVGKNLGREGGECVLLRLNAVQQFFALVVEFGIRYQAAGFHFEEGVDAVVK